MKIVDYSFARPDPAAIKVAGYVGAARYVAPLPNTKVIDKTEYDGLLAAGLSVVLVWESSGQRALAGHDAGVADAREAIRQAQALGYGGAIYYVLEDPTRIMQSQWPQAEAYAAGVGSIHQSTEWAIGGYGSQALVENCINKGLIKYGWQVGGWSAYVSPVCHLYQRLGYVLNNTCDEDTCLQDDWGQWPRTEDWLVTAEGDRIIGTLQSSMKDIRDQIIGQLETDMKNLPASGALAHLSDADLAAIAKAVADEEAKRLGTA